MKKSKAQFANSAAQPAAAVFFANEIAIGADGWAMITKFGDYPSTALFADGKGGMKKEKAIQRVDKAGAEQMVAAFVNARRGIRKFLRGCNIYDGHPDVPGIGKFYPDKEPKGVFADLQVRDDGLYGLPVFTNEGSELVETKKRRAFSGNIGNSEPDGTTADGVPIYRPTEIFSAGLTNNPHLPVNFFNADDTLAEAPAEATNQNKHNNTMKKKIIALLTALSLKPTFANAEAPTDAEAEAALGEIETKVATFANERTTWETASTALKKKLLGLATAVKIQFANESEITDPVATLAQIEQKVTGLTTERDAARTQFANERNARIADELGQAVKTGRITEAQKPTWEARLKIEAQFANEVTAIRALAPAVKTTSITVTRGNREEQIDVNDKAAVRQFVNEAIDAVAIEKGWKLPADYNKAFNEVQRRHGALFANMQAPEISGKKK